MMKTQVMLLIGLSTMLVACQPMASHVQTTTLQKEQTSDSQAIDWTKAGPDAQKLHITFEKVTSDVKNGAVFYDVRSAGEYQRGHFSITTHYPITDLEAGKLPDVPKDTVIYVHCQLGIRSADATKILRDAGYTHVFDLGGIEHVKAIGGVLN